MGKAKGGEGLIQLGALGKQTVTTSRRGGGSRPAFLLPSMSGQSNFAFAVPPRRHQHLRSLGYTPTPPTSVFRERFPLSLRDFEGFQVVSQATPSRLLRTPPSMPVTIIDATTPPQGSREVIELLTEQETRKQESASSNGRFHALTSGHGQNRRVR